MKRFSLVLLLTLAISISACDGFFDVNEDPIAATSADASALFPEVIANLASNNSIEFGPPTNFFTQYWSSGLSTGVFTSPDRYQVSSFMTGNTWSTRYITALKNLALVVQTAEQQDPQLENTAAQAKILAGYTYLGLTELWEDVPFSETIIPPAALSDSLELTDPQFDTQEEVLKGIIALIEEGVNQLDPTSPRAGVVESDLIYEGDLDKWAKFGRSLQLRANILLQSGGLDRTAELNALMQQDLIRSNAANAELPFYEDTDNQNNVWKLYNQFGSGFLWCGKTMVDLMKSLGDEGAGLPYDPRLPTYCNANSADEYVGVPSGVSAFSADSDLGSAEAYPHYSQVSTTAIIRQDYNDRMVTAAEVLLTEAEIAAQQGDLATADEKYEAGVQASLDYFDDIPGDIPEEEEAAYLASLPDLTTLSQSEALDHIYQQQYIALYDQQPSGWTNWRRTQIPELTLPNGAALGDFIRRLPYPPDEASANQTAPEQEALDNPMWFEDGQNENVPTVE